MIRVRYNKELSIYTLRLDNLDFGDGTVITMKFDTGAVNTVIGLRTLFKYLSKKELDTLLSMFEASDIEKVRFNSASGGELWGYPCVVHNVEISNAVIENFCFYVITNTNREVALLGDDFISCCNFRHEQDGDIIITDFDDDEVCMRFKSKSKGLELDEVIKSLKS